MRPRQLFLSPLSPVSCILKNMPEPKVELYDDRQYQASREASERRLAAARQRARRLRRWRVLGTVVLLLGAAVLVAGVVAAARAPGVPYLVVTWPKPKVEQVLAPNQTVLARGGQPFDVAVTEPQNWDVTWKSGGAQQQGGDFKWAPADGTGNLRAICQPRVSGWENSFSFLWPTREVSIASVTAKSGGNYARQLTTPTGGAWVYPHIFAVGAVSWDERALPLMAQTADLLPATEINKKTAPVQPTAGLWQLVSNFEGESNLPSEDGTFASFHAPDLENSLPMIAARIVKSAPEASVKFILRLDRDPQQGIIRIAFDGKRQRQAWVRRKNETTGQPFTGWEDGNFTPKTPAATPAT